MIPSGPPCQAALVFGRPLSIGSVGTVSTSASAPRPQLPTSGPGSPAGWPRRIVAIFIDWFLANAVAFALTGGVVVWDPSAGYTWLPLVAFFVLNAAATVATGASLGQRSEEHTSELQSRGHLVCRRL